MTCYFYFITETVCSVNCCVEPLDHRHCHITVVVFISSETIKSNGDQNCGTEVNTVLVYSFHYSLLHYKYRAQLDIYCQY